MRTTLTLDADADVAAALEAEAHRRREPWKKVVNDAIRRGLSPAIRSRDQRPYRLPVFRGRLLPGVDPGSLNRLVDELEIDTAVAKARPR
jgi:hypothetical protein